MRNPNFSQGDGGAQHRFLYRDGVTVPDNSQFQEIRVPAYWELSYVEDLPGFGAPENRTGRPESLPIHEPTFPDPQRFRSGPYAFKAFTFWQNHAIWLHQTFRVRTDAQYHFIIYAHSFYTRCSTKPHTVPLDSDCSTPIPWAENLLRVGIDPLGAKSPWSPDIAWGPTRQIYGTYGELLLSPIITPRAEYITIYFQSVTSHPLKHNDIYLANAELVEILPEPEQCDAPAREPYAQIIHVYDPGEGKAEYMRVCETVWDDYGPQQLGPASDPPFVGCGLGSKKGYWHHVTEEKWPDYIEFGKTYYPKVDIEMIRLPWGKPPTPPSPPVPRTELLSLHLQTEMDGWVSYYRRLHAHGRPCRWGKFVYGAEASNKIGPYLAEGALYRGVIETGQYINASTPEAGARAALDTYWSAVVQNPYIRAVEGSNEMMGTSSTPDEIRKVVAFEIALSHEVKRRSHILEQEQGRSVIAVLGNLPIGNLQHGAQTALLAPMVDVALENDHGIGYHPYYPGTRDQALTRKWIATEGYHHHLRWQTSWLESIPQLAYARLFGTEGGVIHCTVRSDNRPGDYRASNGWRHPECLNGNVDFYVETLLLYRALALSSPLGANIETVNIFTTGDPGVIKWHNFTFDEPALSVLASALERL